MVTREENFIAIPTAIVSILALISSVILWWVFRHRSKRLLYIAQGEFGLPAGKIYRRCLLLHYIQYMGAFDFCFSVLMLLNWGCITIVQSYAFQETSYLCYTAVVIGLWGLEGSQLFFILIAVATLGRLGVGLNCRCRNHRFCKQLCDRFYPKSIETMQDYSSVFWHQCGLVSILLIAVISTAAITEQLGSEYNLPNNEDLECRPKHNFFLALYTVTITASIFAITTLVLTWRQYFTADVGKEFVWRVTWFIVVFEVTWSFIAGVRIYEQLSGNEVLVWALALHHYLLGINGFLNLIVWITWDPSAIHYNIGDRNERSELAVRSVDYGGVRTSKLELETAP